MQESRKTYPVLTPVANSPALMPTHMSHLLL
jgi:hypothetical protein